MQAVDSFDDSFQVHVDESGRFNSAGMPVTPMGGLRSSSRSRAGVSGSSSLSNNPETAVSESGVRDAFSGTKGPSSSPSVSKSTSKTRRKSTPFTATAAVSSGLSSGLQGENLATTVPVLKTIFVDEQDMNPLKPCGACHEWLKKIAEINTKFCVVTFTDANFTGIYIEQIKDD